jgi:hypothetical protein
MIFPSLLVKASVYTPSAIGGVWAPAGAARTSPAVAAVRPISAIFNMVPPFCEDLCQEYARQGV